MLPRANKDPAITAAAQLACDRSWKSVSADDAAIQIISAALVPLFGISWGKRVIAAVDDLPINRRVVPDSCDGEESPLARITTE